jgi:hypothetical protein
MNNPVQANAPQVNNPQLGQAQFSGYTRAQKVTLIAAVVAAVALTALAAVFLGFAAIAVAVVAGICITAVALSFRARVIAYDTYYLHNPNAPRVAYTFFPPVYIRDWYRVNRPHIITVGHQTRTPFVGRPLGRSPEMVDLGSTWGRQRPGSSSRTTVVSDDAHNVRPGIASRDSILHSTDARQPSRPSLGTTVEARQRPGSSVGASVDARQQLRPTTDSRTAQSAVFGRGGANVAVGGRRP